MKDWKSINQSEDMEVKSDILSLKKIHDGLLTEYSPEGTGEEILVYHLAVLYLRLSRLWSAEAGFLNETTGLSELSPLNRAKIANYGAPDIEILLTRYEPAILSSISKTKALLTKRRKNLVKYLQNT